MIAIVFVVWFYDLIYNNIISSPIIVFIFDMLFRESQQSFGCLFFCISGGINDCSTIGLTFCFHIRIDIMTLCKKTPVKSDSLTKEGPSYSRWVF